MARLLLWAGLILLLQLQLGTAYKLVCYFTSWSRYRPSPASFFPADVDPHLCTHVVYAFASMQNNRIVSKEKDDEEKIYPQLMKLKERNQNLRILLSIGGWYFGTSRFTTMLATYQNRQIFVSSVLFFLRTHGFDGLDLFFLYPAFRGSPSQDRVRFSYLIQELLSAFHDEAWSTGRRRLLVTAAVSGNQNIIKVAYDVSTIARLLDYISVLTYDFHGSWDSVTGHNSPLYGMSWERNQVDYLNCEYAMKLWEKKGAPPEKLIMGFPTYGRTFDILISNKELGAPAFGPAPPGNYTKEAGVWAYYEICPFLEEATKKWIKSQSVPYAYKKNYWVGYDSIRSFAYKFCQRLCDKEKGTVVFVAKRAEDGPEPKREAGTQWAVQSRGLVWGQEWKCRLALGHGQMRSCASALSPGHGGTSSNCVPWCGTDADSAKGRQTSFIRVKNYGGAMVWTLDLDDFKGIFCEQGPSPLVNTIKQILFFQRPNSTHPPNVPTFTSRGEISPQPEKTTLTTVFHTSKNPPTFSSPFNTPYSGLTVDSQRTSSAAGSTTTLLVNSSLFQATSTLEETTLAPDKLTTLQGDESSPSVHSTAPSPDFPSSTPLPQTTNYNASL